MTPEERRQAVDCLPTRDEFLDHIRAAEAEGRAGLEEPRRLLRGMLPDYCRSVCPGHWDGGEWVSSVHEATCIEAGHWLASLINEEPRRQAPHDALAQARAEGRAAALEETVGIVAHARAYYSEDIFSPDGTSPECGHAKWARNLLDGIIHDIRSAALASSPLAGEK